MFLARHGRRWESGLILDIEIPKRLPGGFLHDEARVVVLLDDPRAAGSGAWE